ncbi:PREDICTED: formin-like protein 18 [Calidris pugnax]|uniref:formin-like protein 18 n=1 Tax=Calidris pugnax TaxID=198806 RepID=UPI00071E058F|nr:PREDICTED: formin-like protein 18 [Calidris pugnax]
MAIPRLPSPHGDRATSPGPVPCPRLPARGHLCATARGHRLPSPPPPPPHTAVRVVSGHPSRHSRRLLTAQRPPGPEAGAHTPTVSLAAAATGMGSTAAPARPGWAHPTASASLPARGGRGAALARGQEEGKASTQRWLASKPSRLEVNLKTGHRFPAKAGLKASRDPPYPQGDEAPSLPWNLVMSQPVPKALGALGASPIHGRRKSCTRTHLISLRLAVL